MRMEGEGKKKGTTADLKMSHALHWHIKLILLQKGSNQLFRKTNIVENDIFSSSARAVLQDGYCNITVKEFYI